MNRERYSLRFTMKAEGEDAEVMVYSEIANTKWWGDETTPGDFDKALKDARKNGATRLNVRINSGGGEVYAAVAMRSMIINAGFDSVRVMIEGLCASAATLFATVPGAHVVIAQGSEFMIHNPMTVAWGNASEIAKTVDHLHKLEGQFYDMYSARTGASADTIKDWMDAETWFTAKEACEYGFCDELLESEPAAACVTAQEMEVMKAMYKAVPECIAIMDQTVSNGTPVAGAPTEINHHEEDDSHMDIKDINLDQLRAENPALYDEIAQGAISGERQRMDDIDALTLPGYEAMAAEAKANGTSATDFHRQVVEAQKQKGKDFIAARKKETSPAANVGGGDAGDNDDKTTDQQSDDVAKELAGIADATTVNIADMY